MWYSMTVWPSVYDCNVCLCVSMTVMCALWSRVEVMLNIIVLAHLNVSAVSQVSIIFTMSQSCFVSTKSEISWLVSCLDTSVLAIVSVSEKKCLVYRFTNSLSLSLALSLSDSLICHTNVHWHASRYLWFCCSKRWRIWRQWWCWWHPEL